MKTCLKKEDLESFIETEGLVSYASKGYYEIVDYSYKSKISFDLNVVKSNAHLVEFKRPYFTKEYHTKEIFSSYDEKNFLWARISLGIIEDCCWIDFYNVFPEKVKKGYINDCLEEAIRWSKEQQAKSLYIELSFDNLAWIDAVRKNGFTLYEVTSMNTKSKPFTMIYQYDPLEIKKK